MSLKLKRSNELRSLNRRKSVKLQSLSKLVMNLGKMSPMKRCAFIHS